MLSHRLEEDASSSSHPELDSPPLESAQRLSRIEARLDAAARALSRRSGRRWQTWRAKLHRFLFQPQNTVNTELLAAVRESVGLNYQLASNIADLQAEIVQLRSRLATLETSRSSAMETMPEYRDQETALTASEVALLLNLSCD